jgi:type II secretory pathway pseudopilin PulG
MALQPRYRYLASIELNTMRNLNQIRTGTSRQRGFMLIELLISMIVLTVGLSGLLILMISAMYTDKNAGHDTTSTMVAEHVLEQVTAQGIGANSPPIPPLTVTDCAGNVLNINTARAVYGAGSGANGGNGANLTAAGIIDWTQAFGAVPAGYGMQYVACGANGRQMTYDVRWNVIQMSGNSRLTVISARPVGSRQVGGLTFIFPVNLRTID